MAAAWEGEPGRTPVSGLAIVTDPEQAEVAWIPAALLADDRVAIALAGHHDIRGHNVKPLMRSLLAAGADAEGLTLDTAIAAYLIDPAEARYTLPDLIEKYTRFARPSDVGHGRPARPRRHVDERRRTRRP